MPAGWDSNPSAWPERGVLVGLALAGAAVAGYLTLVQVGVVASAWEPFFGAGSERVLRCGLAQPRLAARFAVDADGPVCCHSSS